MREHPKAVKSIIQNIFQSWQEASRRDQNMLTIQELLTIMLFFVAMGLYFHEARENEELRRDMATMRRALKKLNNV